MSLHALEGVTSLGVFCLATSWQSSGEASVWLLGFALTLLVLYLVARVIRNTKLQRNLEARMSELGIKGAHAAILQQMARHAGEEDSTLLMEHISTFEVGVHHYLESLSSASQDERRDAARSIRFLRIHLGFQRVPGMRYHSTREFERGTQVELLFTLAGKEVSARALVGEFGEDALVLVKLEPALKEFAGQSVVGMHMAQGNRYRFETQVLEVDTARKRCVLAHSLKLMPADRRRWRRVKTELPVLYRDGTDTAGPSHEGTLQDLSAGGAAVLCQSEHGRGENLVLSLRAEHFTPNAPGVGQAFGRPYDLVGAIRRAEDTEGGQRLCRLEFQDVGSDDTQRLSRLVDMIDSELRSRHSE